MTFIIVWQAEVNQQPANELTNNLFSRDSHILPVYNRRLPRFFMKVILATGIYPPAIGGPATYVEELGKRLVENGCEVTVITYGDDVPEHDPLRVIRVSKKGGPTTRWTRYAAALRKHGAHADIVYAFSSVSVGVPLLLARLKGPRKILRLGGDFLWERFTDRGGMLSLKEWYARGFWFHGVMNGILKSLDHIVFSTAFQEELYDRFYRQLPLHSVIENALPAGEPILRQRHQPLRLLFLGRFVAFKNIGALLTALCDLPEMVLTIVGSGPLEVALKSQVEQLGLQLRVTFQPQISGGRKKQLLFLEHDLLVLPSLTEISPNAALEARASGLPVLLTEETGLSRSLVDGAALRVLRTPAEITVALHEVQDGYDQLAERAAAKLPERGWDQVCEEHLQLFRSLL